MKGNEALRKKPSFFFSAGVVQGTQLPKGKGIKLFCVILNFHTRFQAHSEDPQHQGQELAASDTPLKVKRFYHTEPSPNELFRWKIHQHHTIIIIIIITMLLLWIGHYKSCFNKQEAPVKRAATVTLAGCAQTHLLDHSVNGKLPYHVTFSYFQGI